jgi:hypothetical protein
LDRPSPAIAIEGAKIMSPISAVPQALAVHRFDVVFWHNCILTLTQKRKTFLNIQNAIRSIQP